MGSVAIAVGSLVVGEKLSSDAQEKAARGAEQAAAENVRFLQERGQLAATQQQQRLGEARGALSDVPGAAIEPIQQFADIGRQGFDVASANILAGGGQQGLTDAISRQARQSVMGRRGINLTPVVQRELDRQARFTGEQFAPDFNQALLSGVGRVGVSGAGDIAGILARTGTAGGDIERQVAAQEAANLIGLVAPSAQQIQTGQEARLLAGISGDQSTTRIAEGLANIAGRNL